MARTAAEGPFDVDLRDFPLVRIQSPNVADYDYVHIPSYFGCVDRGLEQGSPFVILHDVRDLPNVDDTRRAEFMAHLDRRRPVVSKRVLAYAAIVGSPLDRGIFTAFMWTVKLPFPIRIFTREAEASRWLMQRFAERTPLAPTTGAPLA